METSFRGVPQLSWYLSMIIPIIRQRGLENDDNYHKVNFLRNSRHFIHFIKWRCKGRGGSKSLFGIIIDVNDDNIVDGPLGKSDKTFYFNISLLSTLYAYTPHNYVQCTWIWMSPPHLGWVYESHCLLWEALEAGSDLYGQEIYHQEMSFDRNRSSRTSDYLTWTNQDTSLQTDTHLSYLRLHNTWSEYAMISLFSLSKFCVGFINYRYI